MASGSVSIFSSSLSPVARRAEAKSWPPNLPTPHFIPDLTNHSHARNLTRKLIERGFDDEQIEKILFGNWMRIFEEMSAC